MENNAVRLHWDRSLLVGKAASGELLIVDGEETIRRTVAKQEIQSGRLEYRPFTGDVTFVLSAYGPNGFSANQVLRWIEPLRAVARKSTTAPPVPAIDEPPARETTALQTTSSHVTNSAPVRTPVGVEVAKSTPPPTPPPAPPRVAEAVAEHRESSKPAEALAKPQPRQVAEAMPVAESDADQPVRGRNWKKPLKWLHGKTSRIWSFGRKSSESDQ